MRILYFSRDYSTHDHRFLTAAASRHEVHFLRLQDDAIGYEQRPLPQGVKLVAWRGLGPGVASPASCLGAMSDLERVLSDVAPDVVHAGPIHLCAFMTALAGFRPLIAMSWGSDILVDAQRDDEHRWATSAALRQADLVVCDCDTVREEAQRYAPLRHEQFVQLPWGIDLDRHPLRAVHARANTGEVNVLSTRSWAEIYDIETVIRSFAQARTRDARLRLVLVGDGPLAPRVHALLEGEQLGQYVRLAGRLGQDALQREYAAADVYLSCALSDGTSISLLEAMAAGLPVVVTDAPGNREWVVPDTGGWLAAARDVAAFADGIVAAAGLGGHAVSAVAEHNRAVIEARADWSRNVTTLMTAYATIERSLGGRSGQPAST
jgi:glycosyltransferase involved in cell wall biosynthesis